MIIKSLKLRNFRNYGDVSIEPGSHMNLLTGMNAQGKTNLLESLVYLSLTRSHRISDDKKMIREGCSFADISCVLEEDGRTTDLQAVIHEKGKTLLIRRQPVKKSSDFVGILNVILFSPDDLRLFTDSPKERRRVMNQEITKISPKYLLALNRYQALMKDRNILLKNDKIDENLLSSIDEQMSENAALIIQERSRFITDIDTYLDKYYRELSSDDLSVSLQYKCCLDTDPAPERFLELLKMNRSEDIFKRTTTAGIHREDMIFMMNGQNLIDTASQGQKRMMMLSFKFSLLDHIRNTTGRIPVLLLDDVLSELDINKQKKLLEMADSRYQCLITSTDVPRISSADLKRFYIDDGKIVPLGGNDE
ncbi:MAG: DNA replication/repair protein RecF [Solobacterium sp.]|nr:DNA replication/repair protein RecF [Solobacterium sp.]